MWQGGQSAQFQPGNWGASWEIPSTGYRFARPRTRVLSTAWPTDRPRLPSMLERAPSVRGGIVAAAAIREGSLEEVALMFREHSCSPCSFLSFQCAFIEF